MEKPPKKRFPKKKSPRSKISKLLEKYWLGLLILFSVSLFIRLPLFGTVYWRTSDAVEYISLARNIAHGEGFTQSMMTRYFDDHPVITSAFHGRTSFLSIILAGILLLGGNVYVMQIFGFVLSGINACLVYILCREWIEPRWSLVAGLLAALNPNIFINSRLILSEPLFSTFVLVTLIIVFRVRERIVKYAFTGATIAFSYLTRTEGLFLLPLVAVIGIGSPKRFVKTIVFLASFAIVALPFFYGNYLVNGNPFYSHHNRLYSVRDLREGIGGNGFGEVFPTPVAFAMDNIPWILQREVSVFADSLYSLVRFDFFGPFLFFILLLFFKQIWKTFKIFYIYSGIVFLIYISAWSAIFERSRHFTTLFLLLLIPLTYALQKLAKTHFRIVISLLIFVFLSYMGYDIHRIGWARNVDPHVDIWSKPFKKPVYAWILKHARKHDIISTTSPEMITLQTNRPTIRTPNNLKADNYETYVTHYKVKYFLVEGQDRYELFDQLADVRARFSDSQVYEVR